MLTGSLSVAEDRFPRPQLLKITAMQSCMLQRSKVSLWQLIGTWQYIGHDCLTGTYIYHSQTERKTLRKGFLASYVFPFHPVLSIKEQFFVGLSPSTFAYPLQKKNQISRLHWAFSPLLPSFVTKYPIGMIRIFFYPLSYPDVFFYPDSYGIDHPIHIRVV